MYGDTARFALTHDRMIASSAHYSRPAVHWLGSAGHLGLDSDDSSPCTARLLRPTDDLSLHTGHVDHSTARSTTAPAQSKHSHGDMNALPHRSFTHSATAQTRTVAALIPRVTQPDRTDIRNFYGTPY
jgi:hypothetical protein